MAQIFDEKGQQVPVTVVKVGPCRVVAVRTPEINGYAAVQLGFEETKSHRLTKPVLGHLKAANAGLAKILREVQHDGEAPGVGDVIGAELFAAGDKVAVSGISKGKGFAGVVKRHHFHGADMTHGSMIHRKPQSSGATDAARTFKGVKKPGRMGGVRVTQKGLTVVRVDAEKGLLLLRGAVPGPNSGLVTVTKQQG
jgi:large subunit ribosomal protein L3